MAEAYVYFDVRRPLVSGMYPVRIRVKHRGRFLINTGVDVFKEDWGGNEVLKSDRMSKTKNSRILGKLNLISKMLLSFELENKLNALSDVQLKHALEGEKVERVTPFIEYFNQYCDKLYKVRTREIYMQTKNKIEIYDHRVTLNDITVSWLEGFEAFMRSQKLAINTISLHMRNVRSIFNYCIDNDYINTYPFRKYKIRSEETAKRSLNIDQLRNFINYPVEAHLERYRDLFMLSFYLIGINMIDMLSARSTDLSNGRLIFRRSKTNKLYSIKVQPEALEIINKYKGGRHLINIMDTYVEHKNFVKQINKYLKKIGEVEVVGFKGKKQINAEFPELSTYWARHTWATIAASLDIPKETISHALGHGNNTVTDVYIDFNLNKVDEANRKVIDYVLQLETETEKPS